MDKRRAMEIALGCVQRRKRLVGVRASVYRRYEVKYPWVKRVLKEWEELGESEKVLKEAIETPGWY